MNTMHVGHSQPSSNQEEIPAETWEAWNRVLTPAAQQQLRSARGLVGAGNKSLSLKPEEQLPTLYALALELRDRLRFSQRRVADLKEEVAAARHETDAEKQRTATRLMVFEAEIDRLRQGMTHHSTTLETHAQLTWQLQADLAHARAQAQASQAEVEEVRQQCQVEIQAAKAELEACKRQSEVDIQAGIQKAAAEAGASRMQMEAQIQADIAAARAQSEEYCTQLDNYRRDLQAHAQADIEAAMTALEEAERRTTEAEARASAAESQKESLLEELQHVAAQVDDIASRQENHGRTQSDLMAALVASKARLSEMHVLEGLYRQAQDELGRLDKENMELKDMWQQGAAELGTSRLLEGLPSGLNKLAPPSLLTAYTGTKKSVKGKKKNGWIQDCISNGGIQTTARPAPGAFPSSLPGMAYLGPSSRMYPPDPDSYAYVRVGGGYDPKHMGTAVLPKASGWVPKDVVKVVQAFRHAYKLHLPEWPSWEPLLLLIDEVYRSYQKKLQLQVPSMSRVPGNMAPLVQLPHVVQNSHIMGLKRQLENMRRSLGMKDSRDAATLKKIAEKEYHLTRQLDEAIEQNVQLRRAVSELDNGGHC